MSKNIIQKDLNKNSITKKYRNAMSLDNEKYILTQMNNKKLTPQLLNSTSSSLTILYVEGKHYLEILEQLDTGEIEFSNGIILFEKLMNWIFSFEQAFFSLTNKYIVLQDIHLRNFILSDETNDVIGIDFETWTYGKIEDNFASLLVCITSYRLNKPQIANDIYEHLLNLLLLNKDINNNELYKCIEQKKKQLYLRRATKPLFFSSTAVVLMGGKSSRMNYKKKSFLTIGEYTFLDYILYQLESFNNIALSVDSKKKYEACKVTLWEDDFNAIGPIGGLYTALNKTKTPLIFITACDTPNITHDLITHLYSQLSEEDDCLIPVIDGQLHPLFGIYHKRILPIISQQIKEENYKMQILLNNISTHYIHLSSDYKEQLANINTPDDYALELLKKHD